MNETMIPENLQNSTTNVIQRLLLALKQREEDNSISSFVKIKKKRTKGALPVGQFIRIQTAQAHGIEEFSITAGKQTWVTINAGDQSSTISGYRESKKIKYSTNTE